METVSLRSNSGCGYLCAHMYIEQFSWKTLKLEIFYLLHKNSFFILEITIINLISFLKIRHSHSYSLKCEVKGKMYHSIYVYIFFVCLKRELCPHYFASWPHHPRLWFGWLVVSRCLRCNWRAQTFVCFMQDKK